jgi:hypothetical protein
LGCIVVTSSSIHGAAEKYVCGVDSGGSGWGGKESRDVGGCEAKLCSNGRHTKRVTDMRVRAHTLTHTHTQKHLRSFEAIRGMDLCVGHEGMTTLLITPC